MSGSTIGGFAGAGIGFLFGGPAGARWGWTIGSLVGGYVAPEKIEGPRLTDAQKQTSQEGVPIPFGFGTFPCMGNIIWADELVEHKHKEGGKGGPQQISYTYTRSFAIAFCEAPYPDGIAGYQKVLINGKLVYDVSPDSEIAGDNSKFLEYATLYTGSETQEPDPTMEAVKGAGNVSAHRGLAFIVFTDYDCTDTQGAIPQVEVVIQTCGTVTEAPDFLLDTIGPEFYYPQTDGGSSLVDLTGNHDPMDLYGDASSGGGGLTIDQDGNAYVSQGTGLDNLSTYSIFIKVRILAEPLSNNRHIWGAVTNSILGYYQAAIFLIDDGAGVYRRLGVGINAMAGGGQQAYAPFNLEVGTDYMVGLIRDGSSLHCVVNGAIVDTVACVGTFSGTAAFQCGNHFSLSSLQQTTRDLVGVARAVTTIESALMTYAMGIVPDGWHEVPDSPGSIIAPDGTVYSLSGSVIDACVVTLDEIVTELCARSGIDTATELDVSELTDEVTGFVCATESSAEGYIEALRLGYYFDRFECDKKLRFPKRGKAPVASLTVDDLVRLDEGKPCIEQTQIQEAELLRKVNVMTLDPAMDYRMGKQTWERRAGTVQAKGESTIEIPVVCTADEAAQMAEKRGKIAWAETDKFRFGLPPKWSKLTPTDDVTLTDSRGVVHRLRLQDLNAVAGVISIEEAIKNRASVYTDAVATGTSNPNTGTGNTGGTLAGPTLLAILNLPQMRSQDTSGIYVGMAGILPGWKGAQLLLSFDGGLTYTPVLTITSATTMGYLTSDCASGTEPLQVRVYGGQLASATTAQVAAGANTSAVLTAGVAELMAYEDATETSPDYYDLETTTWELKGTAAGSHLEDDQFVDMATAYFVPIDTAFAGQTLYAKAVSAGVSADAVAAVSFVYEGMTTVIDGGEIT